MDLRILARVVAALLVATPLVAQQTATPKLSRNQRDTLQAIIAAVDAAAGVPASEDVPWQTHVLRASDGSHYVAFSIVPPASIALEGPATLYVRLATRPESQAVALAERSAVMEWLKGMRSDPLVSQKQRGIAFGEMPMFGPGAIATRGPGTQSGDLALLGMERERARERKEAADRERKAALEGTATRPRDAIYPFEDFAVDVTLPASDAAPVLRRSLTAGPGDYDLYVAWAAPEARDRKAAVRVVKRTLRLAPASATELAVSSVILADEVGTRETPYPADQQSSHPYAIGAMEIVPARDAIFSNDERLAVVFQVMNPGTNAAGKPDISIGFQLFRTTAAGEVSVGMLNPQYYNETTLPLDFDVTKGHPIFAAMAAPLKTLARGDYRLKITVADKIAGRSTLTDTTFKIVGTPATLLAAAPLGTPLRREALLELAFLREIAGRLRSGDRNPRNLLPGLPASPALPDPMSPALTATIDALAEGRFVDLLREDAVDARERGIRTALRGIGLYALGDPRMSGTMLRQAIQQTSPNPVAQLFAGAGRALEANDRDAVSAWQAALDGGLPSTIVAPLLVDAHLRLGDTARAAAIARTALESGSIASAAVRGVATLHITERREAEAIELLNRHLTQHADDLDAQFLMLHALFASIVRGQGPGTTAEGKERFRTLARAYIETKGRNATLVGEWLEMVR